MAVGIKLRYTKPHNGLVTVPLLAKPLFWDSLKKVCPLCQVSHPVKTVHLWLDDTGTCLVSEGVLEDLRKAGMPDLEVKGSTDDPPPLQIGRKTRIEVDAENRKIVVFSPLAKGT